MEWFKERALETSKANLKNWFKYINNTFLLFQHGEEKLKNFLKHINNIHSNI